MRSFLYIAASLSVDTFGDGISTLTCSAEGVRDMQWSVSYFGMTQNIDLDTIQDSAIEDFTVTDGITLSSTVYYGNIESTMSVISHSGSGVQTTQVTFVCYAITKSGGYMGRFRKERTITLALANPTAPSEVPETSLPSTSKLQCCKS